ncbi:MAG: ABC transporter substrate-binding protein, partial [Planctomycetota bacterium]
MTFSQRLHVVATLLLVALLLASCSRQEASPSAPVKLKVLVLPYLGYLPFFIAQEKGYFTRNGLDVELVETSSARDVFPLLIQGGLDVYSGTIHSGILNAIHRGADVRIVADKGTFGPSAHAYYAILVRRDLAESGALSDPARLKGLRVAQTLGSSTQYVLETLLASVGLTLEDLQVRDTPSVLRGEALANGAVDVAGNAEPWVTRILDTGAASVW